MILEKFAFFGHFSVSYESKVLKIKNESTPFFAIASRFVTFFWYGHAKKSYPISLDCSAFVSTQNYIDEKMYLQFILFNLFFL